MEASHLPCAFCGASVPLVSAHHVRCLYCLHDAPVPLAARRAIVTQQALDAPIEHVAREVERARAADGAGDRHAVGGGVAASVLGLFYCLMYGPSLEGLLLGSMYGLLMFAMAAAMVVPVFVRRRTEIRLLAGAPLATPWAVGQAGIAASCPACGAWLPRGETDVVARCRHCGTDALLPASMVAAALWGKHARVMRARMRGDAHEVAKRASTQASRRLGYVVLACVGLTYVGVIAFSVVMRLIGR